MKLARSASTRSSCEIIGKREQRRNYWKMNNYIASARRPRHIITNEYFTHTSSVRFILAPRQQRGDADVAEGVALGILPDEPLAPAVDVIRDCSGLIAGKSHA
jgi:hypothetical protein